jgi:GMP synthase (glutamine-hydrolysing)
MKRILILQAGSTEPTVGARFGDYPDWFAAHLSLAVALSVVRPYEAVPPEPEAFDGILCTGSPRSVLEDEPWMERLGAYLLSAAERRPVLCVCFGHQVVGQALGARVERNPWGREAGTAEVRLTEAGRSDPLFQGLPDPLFVQQTHEDHLAELPEGAVLLATNAQSPVQAFAYGPNLRCLQFHPEMDAVRSRALAEARRQRLDETAPGGAVAVLSSIRETSQATRCLHHWVERFVR